MLVLGLIWFAGCSCCCGLQLCLCLLVYCFWVVVLPGIFVGVCCGWWFLVVVGGLVGLGFMGLRVGCAVFWFGSGCCLIVLVLLCLDVRGLICCFVSCCLLACWFRFWCGLVIVGY